MKHKISNIKNWKLAILFSAILSLFGVISNRSTQSDFDLIMILPNWLLTFCFLLIAWAFNSVITNRFFSTIRKGI